MERKEYISVYLKSNGRKFTGVYIKNGDKEDVIVTCAHGIHSKDSTKIKVFTKCQLKESELVIKSLILDEEKDIAILVLENNLNSEIRDYIPSVILDEAVEEGMEYKVSGFPISTLHSVENALKEIFVTLTSKNYCSLYLHKVTLTDYDKENIDEEIVDNLDGFSGSPVYEALREDENLVLLKGIYLGIDDDENTFKIGRVASIDAILHVAKENSIVLECDFEKYLFLELRRIINSILEEEISTISSGRLKSRVRCNLEKTIRFLEENKAKLSEIIAQFLCKKRCLKEDIIIGKPRIKELILTLLHIIDTAKLENNSFIYNGSKNFLFNPNKVTQRPLNIVMKNIIEYLYNNLDSNYQDGNALVYYDIDIETCMNLCHEIKVNTINESLFSSEDMKDDILSANDQFALKFKCSACSNSLNGILKYGEKIWES